VKRLAFLVVLCAGCGGTGAWPGGDAAGPEDRGSGADASMAPDDADLAAAEDDRAEPDWTTEEGPIPEDPGPELAPDQGLDLTVADAGPPCEPGKPCDDGNPCTHSDRCTPAGCIGTPYSCDDGRPCTQDQCDGYGGCRHPIREGHCLIHNVCYATSDASPLNPCVRCDPSVSQTAFALAANGTACGEDDPCLGSGVCEDGQCTGGGVSCDDGNPCTDDSCVVGVGCTHASNHDPCEDGDPCTLGDQCRDGACVTGYLSMDCYDGNPCTLDSCTPEGCENRPASGLCEDGDLCTEGDHCEGGECIPGPPLVCDDGNDCTTDWCESWYGCRHGLVENPCCIGGVHVCNDFNPCTSDDCDPQTGACSHTPITGPCNDGNRCTGPDTCTEGGKCVGPPLSCDDHNPCTSDSCDPAKGCVYQPLVGPCDDGSACTTGDQCVAGQCKGQAVSCDDHNPCTKDTCDPASGCRNEPFTGPCNDGNACTTNDVCAGGACAGVPVDCSDANPCTADSCHPAMGCQHVPVAGACDDHNDCTVNDHCENGQCVGTAQGLCCTPEFSAPVNKVTALALGDSGRPGQALNVDGKPTCSPTDNCEAGLDNSLAPFAGLANQPLQDAVDKGDVILLFEHRGFNLTGNPYTLAFWQGKPVDPGCDIQHQSCAYWVPGDLLDPDCEPLLGFHNAKVSGTKLTAGGVGTNYPFTIPIAPGVNLDVRLANAMVEATLTLQGGKPVAMTGLLAGAVPKADMIAAVQAVPEDQLPISKDLVLQMLNLLIVNDIDTDADGNLDAASIGIRFSAIAGTIAGVKPN